MFLILLLISFTILVAEMVVDQAVVEEVEDALVFNARFVIKQGMMHLFVTIVILLGALVVLLEILDSLPLVLCRILLSSLPVWAWEVFLVSLLPFLEHPRTLTILVFSAFHAWAAVC